jgi:hypothetical protein
MRPEWTNHTAMRLGSAERRAGRQDVVMRTLTPITMDIVACVDRNLRINREVVSKGAAWFYPERRSMVACSS